jgi:hypothetical protein
LHSTATCHSHPNFVDPICSSVMQCKIVEIYPIFWQSISSQHILHCNLVVLFIVVWPLIKTLAIKLEESSQHTVYLVPVQ